MERIQPINSQSLSNDMNKISNINNIKTIDLSILPVGTCKVCINNLKQGDYVIIKIGQWMEYVDNAKDKWKILLTVSNVRLNNMMYIKPQNQDIFVKHNTVFTTDEVTELRYKIPNLASFLSYVTFSTSSPFSGPCNFITFDYLLVAYQHNEPIINNSKIQLYKIKDFTGIDKISLPVSSICIKNDFDAIRELFT